MMCGLDHLGSTSLVQGQSHERPQTSISFYMTSTSQTGGPNAPTWDHASLKRHCFHTPFSVLKGMQPIWGVEIPVFFCGFETGMASGSIQMCKHLNVCVCVCVCVCVLTFQ